MTIAREWIAGLFEHLGLDDEDGFYLYTLPGTLPGAIDVDETWVLGQGPFLCLACSAPCPSFYSVVDMGERRRYAFLVCPEHMAAIKLYTQADPKLMRLGSLN